MQDETNTSQDTEELDNATNASETPQASNVSVQHVYYEVANDLLAKPTALCDILETEGLPSSVIFCNSPSDADLLEVMLKKRGISVKKLVGHVPPAKTTTAMKEARDGQLTAIVVTDIAARNVEVEDVDLVVNYSVPSDPESYIHRMGRSEAGGKKHTIFSLVSPLDIGNFHYIKKFVSSPFVLKELPSGEHMAGAKIKALSTQADRQALHNDPSLLALSKQLLESPSRDAILAFLLHNTLNVMPNLKSSSERGSERGDYDRESYDHQSGSGDRGFRSGQEGSRGGDRRGGRGGRNGRDRDNRGGDRDNRAGDRGGRRGPSRRPFEEQELRQTDIAGRAGVPPPLETSNQDEGDYDQDYDRQPSGRRGGRFEGRERGEPPPPPLRDVRIYIGTGSRDGLSEEKFRSLVTEHAGESADKVKRFSQRGAYSFVDVAEEAADDVVNKMADVSVGGNKLLMKRATTINVPRPREEDRGDDQEQSNGTGPASIEEAGEGF